MSESRTTFIKEESLLPLCKPNSWPPPQPPSGYGQPMWLAHIPVIGALYFWRQRREFVSYCLIPIEQEIHKQLIYRQRFGKHASRLTGRIAECLCRVISAEKGITVTSLHPADPAELFFWGASDDLTLFRFIIELERDFGLTISEDTAKQWIDSNATVGDIVYNLEQLTILRGQDSKDVE